MSRVVKPKTKQLYGEYKNLNKYEIEFIRLATDPECRARGMTDKEMAETIGVNPRTIHNYRQKAEIREAITREMMLKAADDLPDMLLDLKNQALARSPYTGLKAHDRLAAKKLWFKIFGFVDEVREANRETKKSVNRSLEARLRELDEQYNRQDFMETKE